MRHTAIVLCLGALLLGGCAGNSLDETLDSWVYNDINRVIESWGPPADEYQMSNGRTIYTWYYDGGVVALPTYGGGAAAVERYCEVNFITDDEGIVVNWRYEGNAC